MGSWPLIECGFGRWRRCYRFLGQILPSLRFPPNLCPVPMSTYFHFRLSQNPKKGVSDPNDNDDPLRRYAQALVGNTARVQWVSKAKNQRVKCNETPLLPKDTRVHSRGGKTTQNDTEDFQNVIASALRALKPCATVEDVLEAKEAVEAALRGEPDDTSSRAIKLTQGIGFRSVERSSKPLQNDLQNQSNRRDSTSKARGQARSTHTSRAATSLDTTAEVDQDAADTAAARVDKQRKNVPSRRPAWDDRHHIVDPKPRSPCLRSPHVATPVCSHQPTRDPKTPRIRRPCSAAAEAVTATRRGPRGALPQVDMHRAGRSVANAGGGQESISEQSAVTGVMRSRVEAALSRVQGALGSTHPANAHVASSDGPSAGAPCDIIALEQGEGQSRDMDHASMHGRGGRRVEDCEQARVSGSARTAQSADGAAAGMEGGRGSRGAGGDRCDGDVMCATSQRAETSGDGREGGEERALESRIGDTLERLEAVISRLIADRQPSGGATSLRPSTNLLAGGTAEETATGPAAGAVPKRTRSGVLARAVAGAGGVAWLPTQGGMSPVSKRAGVAEVTRRLREIEARREAIARRWQLLPRGGARSGDKRESEPGSEGSLEDGGWGSSWGLGVGEVATSVFGGYGMRDHRVGRKERGEGDAGGSPRHLRGGGAESGRAEGRQEHGARDRREASPGREGSGWRTGTDKEGLREGGTWWGRRVHEAGMRATVRRVMDGRRRFARRLRTLDSVFLGSLAGERGSVAPKSFTEVAERLAEEFLDEVVEREAIALSDGVETVAEDALAGL